MPLIPDSQKAEVGGPRLAWAKAGDLISKLLELSKSINLDWFFVLFCFVVLRGSTQDLSLVGRWFTT
jgi:hypothetical protein